MLHFPLRENSELNLNGDLNNFVVGDDEEDIEYLSDDEEISMDGNSATNDGGRSRRNKRRKAKKRSRRQQRNNGENDSGNTNSFVDDMESQVTAALNNRMQVDDDDEIINRRSDKPVELDEDLKQISLLAHWNLVDYLPEQLQEPFEVIIGEFILKPWKWRKRELAKRRKNAELGKSEFKDLI